MSKKVLSQTITKSQALEGIGTILQNFNNLIIELNWDLPKTNYTELKKFADYMTDEGYLESFRTIPYQTVLDNVDTEGYLELITKCGKLSKLYDLDVEVPENVEVLGEGIVEDFLEELTQYSLNTLNNNKTELTKTYNELLLQTNELNLKDRKQTPLEEIILKSREYKIAKRNADNASTELMNMSASAGSGASYDEKEYARYQQIYNSNTAEMDYIKRNYPLVTFFNGKEDKKAVEKQLGKAYKEINKALDNLIARIHDGKYPIWHFDTLVEQLLEKYEDKDRTVIQNELARMKKKEELTDLLLTIGPMVLSVGLFLIPGGASFILLGLKAGLQVANAAVGVMSAVNDIQDAAIMKDESYASLKISPEVQQLMNKENYDINDAKFQYIVALVSSGFVVFDVMDAVDAFKLIKKCGQLDDVTRNALKQSKRFGEKAFMNCDIEALEKIGNRLPQANATEIFNMKNTVNVVDSLGTKANSKVFTNLSNLEAPKVPVALDFFPNNLNTNIIWLGMENVDAKNVLKIAEDNSAVTKYTRLLDNPKIRLDYGDTPKTVENKLNRLLKSQNKFSDNERIVLLKETLPPKGSITSRTTYIRVQVNNGWTTLASPGKDFAWVTDPYILAGKNLPEDFMNSVGFTKSYINEVGDDRVFFDVIVFKDAKTAESLVPNHVTDWNIISDSFVKNIDVYLQKLKNSKDPKNVEKFYSIQDKLNSLISDDGVFNNELFNRKYLNYFINEHLPGTPYEKGFFEELGKLIENITGASHLYGSGGITISENGLENIERAFYNFDNYQIKQMMHDESAMKIYRYEIVKDISVRSDNSVKVNAVRIGGN